VGWVDLACGILLACNLFDEAPVMRFIPLPASRACITYCEDADPYHHAAEYFCDVVCSGGLIQWTIMASLMRYGKRVSTMMTMDVRGRGKRGGRGRGVVGGRSSGHRHRFWLARH
jgi:hypothetical protein